MTNTQTLSPEDQALLEKPFRVDEHGFLQGKPYIKKSAIRRRLSAVDPGWSQAEPAFVTRDGDVVFYSLSLTVRGVTRSNLGSGIVQTSKTNKDTGEITEYTGFELARNVAKAHKQAASDGLPRAAETFNVTLELVRRGYTEEQIAKIWSGNLLRVVEQAERVAAEMRRE